MLNHLDANKAAFLVLLDMSAAFDTVDHNILVNRLDNRFGITGQVKSWFQSYLSSRTIQVKIQQDLSRSHTMNYSLPQGSIIGPLGFTLYVSPVGDIIRRHNVNFHCYADDIQLYDFFDPKIEGDDERVLSKISACIVEISLWMFENKLQRNQDKTEFFVISNSYFHKKLQHLKVY